MKLNGIAGLLGRDTRSLASSWSQQEEPIVKIKGVVCMENTQTHERAFLAPVANQKKKPDVK
jgi:hypothetical protein